MKKRLGWQVITDAVIIACGALAMVCAVPSAYRTSFSVLDIAAFELLFALIVSLIFHKAKRAWPFALGLAALTLGFGYVLRSAVLTGARLVRYSALSLLSLDFSFLPTPEFPETALDPMLCVNEFLILSAALVTVLLALLVIRCRPRVPALLAPVPAFVPALIYTDSGAALFVIALLLIYWAGVLFGRRALKDGERNSAPAKAIFLLLLAGLALLLPVVSPQERFEPIPFSERRGILDIVGSMRDRMLSRKILIPREYDLASESRHEEDDSAAFSVCSSYPGVIALRTHSYGLYNGNMWLQAKEYPGTWNSMQALGSTQSGQLGYLRIRDAYISERLTPYGFMPRYDITPGESCVKTRGRTAYVWSYLPSQEFTVTELTAAEAEYYKFALQQYTLPDGPLKTRLLNVLELQLSPGAMQYIKNTPNPYVKAQLIARFVSSSGTYSLEPGRVPEGEDFVEYFLTESHRGYCVHYASATTALLQAMGIPARYVIGYRAEIPEAETWYEIPNKASHAWTEVYVRGVGWLPIESTAGFSAEIEYYPSGTGPSILPVETPVPTVTPTVEYTPRPIVPRDTEQATLRPLRTPGVSPRPGGSGTGPAKQTSRFEWRWLLIIPVVVLVWQLVGVVVRRQRKRRFTQKDEKRAVLEMLEYLGSLRKYGGVVPPDPDSLANEAAFSNHDMEETRAKLLDLVEENRTGLCLSTPLKRFALRWLTFRI